MKILEERTKEIDDSLIEKMHPGGYRYVLRGGVPICSESDPEWARMAKIAVKILQSGAKKIAMIGGGFCILPKLLYGRGYEIDVYEIESALEEYHKDARFISGDWRDFLDGTYDILVYDAGEFLAPEDRKRLKASAPIIFGLEE